MRLVGSSIALVTFVATAALAALPAAAADTYAVDRAHSDVSFKIRHLVSNVTGRFNDFSGTVRMDPADLTRSTVSFRIVAASIDTAEPKRDEHLRSADFFDVQKFPELTFESTRIRRAKEGVYDVTGKFTMHGVTKEITIPVEHLGTAKDPWGSERAGFSTTFTLNRKDYGIVWNKVLDAGGVMLGEEVRATVNLETVKEKAPAK